MPCKPLNNRRPSLKSIISVIGTERVRQLLRAAMKEAAAERRAAGLPAVSFIDGVVCLRLDDGPWVDIDSDEGRAIEEEVKARRAQRP